MTQILLLSYFVINIFLIHIKFVKKENINILDAINIIVYFFFGIVIECSAYADKILITFLSLFLLDIFLTNFHLKYYFKFGYIKNLTRSDLETLVKKAQEYKIKHPNNIFYSIFIKSVLDICSEYRKINETK